MKPLSLVLHLSFIILASSLSAKPNILFIISDDLTDGKIPPEKERTAIGFQ